MTRVETLLAIGIRRVAAGPGRFRYENADGSAPSSEDEVRARRLGLPPAWSDVRIDPSATASLQAIGRDAAGRWQYRYHDSRVASREREKAARLRKFAARFPALRAAVAKDLRRPGLPREKVLAAMTRILATRYLRPGSRAYAVENESYGITTLRKRHVSFRNGGAELRFRGKAGKQRCVDTDDRGAVAVLRLCAKLPGRALFQSRDADGSVAAVRRRQLNAYIRDSMGEGFSAKDFRTWAGTLICANELARSSDGDADSKAGRRRRIVAAVAETARRLGNTPAVCRSSYISPRVISSFERGVTLRVTVPSVERLGRRVAPHPIERELGKLLAEGG